MQLELGGNPFTLYEGELAIVPPKQLHKGYTCDIYVDYDVMMFDIRSFYNETELCQNFLPAVFDGRAQFKSVTSNEDILICFDSIMHSATSFDTIAKIYNLIGFFFKNELLHFSASAKDAFSKKVIDYFEDNIAGEISTDSLCKKFSYTPTHLCRKFKKETGLSPMNYLKIYRLELACKKIKEGNTTISDVATQFGFSDANYFTRCFKAHFGVAPTRYYKIK